MRHSFRRSLLLRRQRDRRRGVQRGRAAPRARPPPWRGSRPSPGRSRGSVSGSAASADRGLQRVRRQPAIARAMSVSYCPISARSAPAFRLPAERIERGAAQPLAVPQQAEQRQREPPGDGDLAAPSGGGIDAGDQRRRQMEHRLGAVAAPRRAGARPRIRPCRPSRGTAPRRRRGRSGRARRTTAVSRADGGLGQGAVAGGVGARSGTSTSRAARSSISASSASGGASAGCGQDLVGQLRIGGQDAAPQEGALVQRDRGAVQLDRAQDRRLAHRHQPALPGEAEQHRVHRLRVAEQASRPAARRAARCRRRRASRARWCAGADPASITRRGSRLNSAVAARSRLPITAQPGAQRSSTPGPAPTARSAASIRSALPSGMRTTSSAGVRADLHMRDDGAVLLRQPGEVERAAPRGLPDAPPSPGSRRR